jgi:hypothetical protein
MISKNNSSGLSLTAVIFIVFLILKLTGNIDWSWWWITSPLWIPIAFVLSIFFIAIFITIIALIFGSSIDDIKEKVEYFKKFKK